MNRILEITGEFIYVFLNIILLPLFVIVQFFIYTLMLAKFVKKQHVRWPRLKPDSNGQGRFGFPTAMRLKTLSN